MIRRAQGLAITDQTDEAWRWLVQATGMKLTDVANRAIQIYAQLVAATSEVNARQPCVHLTFDDGMSLCVSRTDIPNRHHGR